MQEPEKLRNQILWNWIYMLLWCDAGKGTWIFYKSSKFLTAEPFSSPLTFDMYTSMESSLQTKQLTHR